MRAIVHQNAHTNSEALDEIFPIHWAEYPQQKGKSGDKLYPLTNNLMTLCGIELILVQVKSAHTQARKNTAIRLEKRKI
jgi:hypothetical protein